MEKLVLLGSTGSIGSQAIDLLTSNEVDICVEALTCNRNVEKMLEQAKIVKPKAVGIGDETLYKQYKDDFAKLGIVVFCGEKGLTEISKNYGSIVLNALMGSMGLNPSYETLKAGKKLALANKESIVTSGEILTNTAKAYGGTIIPVDSEHSAIFQSLEGNKQSEIEKIILTASGGPFRGKKAKELVDVTFREALKHPNYSMGRKISIDSATLMNKGLEVIEAKWMFSVETDQIDVVVHPESIVHSLVQYVDCSIIAQLGLPDMKLPILYALTYPDRVKSNLGRLDLAKIGRLNFAEPDKETFPCLELAYESLRRGGYASTVLNAANEKLVDLFLKEQIKFYDIPKWIEIAMNKFDYDDQLEIDTVKELDQTVKKYIEVELGK